VDWNFAAHQPIDLAGVFVHASHRVAEIGKTSPRHKTDVSSSDHRNPHIAFTPKRFCLTPICRTAI
jgi:hypothetical protein